ncbi:MAG: DUF1045 domain-containing protein [Alphaproteobacteria bacterium]|nr:DUF1045 domain-containing protein [Alphaproteobacteria bacterium]
MLVVSRLRLHSVVAFFETACRYWRSCAEMDQPAALCVRELDDFRAAPSAAELARRRRAGLPTRKRLCCSAGALRM